MKSIHRIMILHIHQPSSINYWILDPGVGSKKKKKRGRTAGGSRTPDEISGYPDLLLVLVVCAR